jgi:hypothetical protein
MEIGAGLGKRDVSGGTSAVSPPTKWTGCSRGTRPEPLRTAPVVFHSCQGLARCLLAHHNDRIEFEKRRRQLHGQAIDPGRGGHGIVEYLRTRYRAPSQEPLAADGGLSSGGFHSEETGTGQTRASPGPVRRAGGGVIAGS